VKPTPVASPPGLSVLLSDVILQNAFLDPAEKIETQGPPTGASAWLGSAPAGRPKAAGSARGRRAVKRRRKTESFRAFKWLPSV
jgi:hypothetical protein